MLKVFFGRGYSALIAGVCCLVLVGCIFGLLRDGGTFPAPVRIMICLVGLGMFWGALVGFRQLLNPPLMFSADRRGVTINYNARSDSFSNPGVFLPWQNVAELELREVRAFVATKPGTTWVVICSLKEPVPPPVAELAIKMEQASTGAAVCLDALSGSLKKQELLDRLRQLWQES